MDWVINGCLAVLVAASLAVIASVQPALFQQQAVWFALAAAALILAAQIDWRPLVNYRWIIFGIYFFSLALLVVTYFFAPEIRHARSWLVIGPVQFQTAEFAKLSLVILFSYFFARRHESIAHWYNIAISFLYLAVPASLILLQPDLGSVLILFILWVSYLFISGMGVRHLAVGAAVLALVGVWGWYGFLQDYQRERVIALFRPDYDPLGINYNVIQSKIAIGSGGWWGKGFRQGTQVQLGFLPEAATDFIFAAFIEEWGAVGGVVLLVVFTLLVLRIIAIGAASGTNFARLMTLGTAAVFLLRFLFNIGSSLGLLPVVGLPFPFFSYGGSSILTDALLVGIIQSIAFRFSF